MTKVVNDKGQIWSERNNNVVTVGFTRSFLDSLDQCWHILPANLTRFREKAPLMVVETNDTLISIMSPVSAHFAHWSDKAQNFPYKLTEEDVVLEMNVTEARKTPGRAAPVTFRFDEMAQQIQAAPMDWDAAVNPAPPPVRTLAEREMVRLREAEQVRQMERTIGGNPVRRNRPQDTF